MVVKFLIIYYCNRFFSRKRGESGDRKGKGKTPEPHSPERSKPLGLSIPNSQNLTRNATVKMSQVELNYLNVLLNI